MMTECHFVMTLMIPLRPPLGQVLPEHLVKEAGMGATLPIKLLKEAVQDYMRGAEEALTLPIYDCQCWSAPPSQAGSQAAAKPDVTVPFVTSAELGLLAQAQYFREQTGQPTATLAEVLAQKEFAKTAGGAVPELAVNFAVSSLEGTMGDGEGHVQGSFVTLTITNLPPTVGDMDIMPSDVEERSVLSPPGSKGLMIRRRLAQGPVADLYRRPKRSTRESETLVDFLRDPAIQDRAQSVWAVEVSVMNETDSFHVMLDGVVFGPFTRVRIRPQDQDDKNPVLDKNSALEIMSFFPVLL
jgi:hypothetical protein